MNALDKFLRGCAVKQGRTLIVGSKIHDGTNKPDRRKLYENAVGVDMEMGDGVDHVLNLEVTSPPGLFDHVECTSVLEHSRRPWMLCETLEMAMTNDATILVMVPWVWRIHDYPGDYFRYTPQAIESLLTSVSWERKKYIVEDRLVDEVPKLFHEGTRYMARSELIMFGRKCTSTS